MVFAVALCLAAPTASAQIQIVVDRNLGRESNLAFKFQRVPPPMRDDAAKSAAMLLIAGDVDGNGGDLKALTDDVLPLTADSPDANFFFDAGTLGGRFRLDLGSAIAISRINTYSWHPDTRGPQVYNLYASAGDQPGFNPAPDSATHPASCGWKLIANVDTRPKTGETGGQYGVSIFVSNGSIGTYRYLLFDCGVTESDDDFGNTFYSEIDVITKK